MAEDNMDAEEQELRIKELRFKVKDLERSEKLEKEGELLSKEQALKVAELALKVKELEKSEFRKFSTYTGILAVVIALGGVIGQNIWAGIKNDRMLLSSERAKASKDSAQAIVRQAKAEFNDLKSRLALAKARYDGMQVNIAASNRSIDSIHQILAGLPKGSLSANQKQKINQLFHKSQADLSSQVQLPKEVRPALINPAANSGSATQTTTIANAATEPGTGGVASDHPASVKPSGTDDKSPIKTVGLTEANGRKITAEVYKNILTRFYQVIITVTGTDPARPLTGPVVFHLPDSFEERNPVIVAENNQAVYYLKALSAFKLGAEADGGVTKLEIDLSQVPDAPNKFKNNQ